MQGKHILWVDFDAREYGLGEVAKYSPGFLTRKEIPEMIKKLRQIIEEDMKKAPSERIDSVVWYTDRTNSKDVASLGWTVPEALGIIRFNGYELP